jgi:protein-S-isoprenylcysteine O-methyltransferase Ste14
VAFYLTLLVLGIWKRPHTLTLAVAVIFAGASFPLWILARLQLGEAFSFRASARRLVTTGLEAAFGERYERYRRRTWC